MFLAKAYNNKFALPALPPLGTFTDQKILITGGTSGLGLATAVHLINLGASSVIITGRTLAKAQTARESIIAQTKCAPAVVQVMELDMSTRAGVRNFVARVEKEVEEVDIVYLNAGMLNSGFVMGKEGWVEELQVNVISTALVGALLMPWLKRAGRGRAHLEMVSSGLHRGVEISEGKFPQTDVLKYFNRPENWPKGGLYGISKLLAQYCSNELAKLALGPDGSPQVIVNSLCPGMVKSDLGRSYKTSALMSLGVDSFMLLMSKTTEGGARTLVRAATTTKAQHGMHFSDYQGREEYERAVQKNMLGPEGRAMQARVWKEVQDAFDA